MRTKHNRLTPSSLTKHRQTPETVGEEQEKAAPAYQPIIGVPLPVQQGSHGPLLLADAVSAWAVERMGAKVFLIPLWSVPPHEHIYHSLWPLLQFVDGFLLPAGPQEMQWSARWQEEPQQTGPHHWSNDWEMALVQLATFLGMPLLALADGAEKWNRALGGKEAPPPEISTHTEGHTPDTWNHRTIRIRTPSKLASYVQPALTPEKHTHQPWELAVPTSQHVEQLASGLRSSAQSEDGALIAFERQDAPFGLGILGRLDWGVDQIYGTAIFHAFLHACRSFHATREQNTIGNASRDAICTTLSERTTQGLPLLSLPRSARNERTQRARFHSEALLTSPTSTPRYQEHFHQRSHPLTKEELNRMRRQRLKGASREI